MNISTYESRIKALEDQLNPPGPSGNAGNIVSISISPDFGNVNSKLAAMMPLRWEDGTPNEELSESNRFHKIDISSDEAPEQPEQVSITVTPSSGGYPVAYNQADDQVTFGEKDEPMIVTMTKTSGLHQLYAEVGASDANSEETASRITWAVLYINY